MTGTRIGYERERGPGGPSLEEQRRSMKEADVWLEGHARVHTDLLKDQKRSGPLVHRARAINALRGKDGDQLVVHDDATLGRTLEEIAEGMAAIGKKGCTLIIWKPEPTEYTWEPGAGEMLEVAIRGASRLRSEKHRTAEKKTTGAAPKLVGAALEAAKAAWADPELTARAAAEKVLEVSGVHISSRLLFAKLGPKSEAEAQVLKPSMPVGVKKKRTAGPTKKRS